MITNPTVLDYVIAAQRSDPLRQRAAIDTTGRGWLLRLPRLAFALKRTPATPRHAA